MLNAVMRLANQPPVVDAGADANIVAGSTVNISGTASDPETDPLTYQWTQQSGPAVTLSSATTLTPTFVAPVKTNGAQILVFRLVANDGGSDSAPGDVAFTIPANIGPTANAGSPQSVAGGSSVSLDGSASTDGDGDTLTYQWTQTGGPAVTLAGDTTLTPSFTAPPRAIGQQTLTFSLVANDGHVNSAADSVDIIIPANQPPVANAGNTQNVAGGAAVSLDGSASSDPDGDPLNFFWTQISGPPVTLTGSNSATPSFVAPASTSNVQTLVFRLTVADPFDASNSSTVDIIIAANQPPIADAGPDQSVAGNSNVTLDGSGSSDPEGDPINYSWVQTGGPAVTLNNSSSVGPNFAAPAGNATNQTLTFQLTVNDNTSRPVGGGNLIAGPSPQQDTVEVTILANNPPVADAGTDQGPIDSGQTVALDGTASSDPEDDNLTYSWTQISGTQVSLTGGTGATPNFVAPLVNGNEDLVFQLVVNDGQADSPPDTVRVSIRAVGTITIIQRILGSDTSVAYSSDISALNGAIVTSGGVGQLVAGNVSAGAHSVSAADLSSAGYTITSISCNDGDSITNLASRSIAIALSPNEDLVCTFTSANTREAAGNGDQRLPDRAQRAYSIASARFAAPTGPAPGQFRFCRNGYRLRSAGTRIRQATVQLLGQQWSGPCFDQPEHRCSSNWRS